MANSTKDFDAIKFAFAIVGEKAAGKGEVARILEKETGAYRMRFSDPIRITHILAAAGPLHTGPDMATIADKTAEFLSTSRSVGSDAFSVEFYRKNGIEPPSTFELQDIANRLRAAHGAGFFTEILLRVASRLGLEDLIIDGVRNPGELSPLEAGIPGRYVLLGVVANLGIRKKRFLEGRMRIGDPKTDEDFMRLEKRDKGEDEPDDGQQVARCLAQVMPENRITNDGGLEELEHSVKTWLSTINY